MPSTTADQTMRSAKSAGPMRTFVRTESGGAVALVLAVGVALVWANVAPKVYSSFWTAILPVRIGPLAAAFDVRTWINSGLMTLFFLVVGLEARREFDLGDLRDRRRLILPVAAGLVGMAVPVVIYLGLNRGGAASHGWGVAMSSDTALALGAFVLVGRGVPRRVRAFLLTVFVVDDVLALLVIAIAYSGRVNPIAIAVAVVLYVALLAARRLPYPRRRLAYVALGVSIWASLMASGVDPVVAGLAIGLATLAYEPARTSLERAMASVRLFREQPSAELARTATTTLEAAVSPNERLQHFHHRWTSFAVVPLFALANAGIVVNPSVLARALAAPVTLGVFLGYVIGKPVAVTGTSWILTAVTRGRLRPQVGWGAVLGSGTVAGMGFTVSLLIADLAFHGETLQDAKLGILAAAVAAFLASGLVFQVIATLPEPRRSRVLLGDTPQLTDLDAPVDAARDHVRGPESAGVTVVEYGDYECPWTSMASPTARELLAADPDLRYVWRHLPLSDVHPHARLAAEAAEAGGAQGRFWDMHEMLLANQTNLEPGDIVDYAGRIDLDVDRFRTDLAAHAYATRVAQDVESADLSGVSGTPTFFINGQRHHGPQDLETLTKVIAMSRASMASGRSGAPDPAPAPRPGTVAADPVFTVSPAVGPLPPIVVPDPRGGPSPVVRIARVLRDRIKARMRRATVSVNECNTPGARPGRGGAAMSDAPANARYSADHLWVLPRDGGGLVRVGLTDFAQESLGDVMAVTSPQAGSAITTGVACGEVESTKSVSELVAPLTGTVRDRNEALDDDPAIVNDDPYGKGWLFDVEVEPSTLTDQLGRLMGASDYERLVAG